jgi:16S rRNA C1402 (ribose-2'-O) methylase RsmI
LADLYRRFGAVELCLARELTKVHQSLTVHTLPVVLSEQRGEFTVVVNLGSITKQNQAQPPSAREIATEFGELTNNDGLTRRQAISALSRKYRTPAREIFAALEAAKSSVG